MTKTHGDFPGPSFFWRTSLDVVTIEANESTSIPSVFVILAFGSFLPLGQILAGGYCHHTYRSPVVVVVVVRMNPTRVNNQNPHAGTLFGPRLTFFHIRQTEGLTEPILDDPRVGLQF